MAPPSCSCFFSSWSAGREAPGREAPKHLHPETGSKIDQKHVDGYAFFMCIPVQSHRKIPKGPKF